MKARIGIDSQCVSYIISAMAGTSIPVDGLATEKIALFRTYLYLPDTFYITPTVKEECGRISNETDRARHEDFISALFVETFPDDVAEIDKLTKLYLGYHAKKKDCTVLAEAEAGVVNVLLTYDYRFLKKLSGRSPRVRVMKPSIFWNDLSVPRGAKPDKIPHRTNPIAAYNWWNW